MDGDPRVRLWVVPVGRPGAAVTAPGRWPTTSLEVLDYSERQRAASFHHEEDRVRYQHAHVTLRHVLGEVLGVAPADLVFGRMPCPRCGGPHGRPTLADPPEAVQFSLAASGDLAAVAVCDTPVGVDVERIADAETVQRVGELLHPTERAEIQRASPARRAQVFTAIWTRKEALGKARGDGLATDLADAYLGSNPHLPGFPAGWQITSVPVAGPYQAAVAVARTPETPGDQEVQIVSSGDLPS